MWQSYALGSMVAGAFEGVLDKAGFVRDGIVDSYAATWYRVAFFFLATLIIGFSGLMGEMEFFFHWSLAPYGLAAVASSLLYTYLLRHLEITSIGALAYLAAFAFLFVDSSVLSVEFSPWQVAGMVLLVCGGVGFALDGATHRLKKVFTPRVLGAFLFVYLGMAGYEAYLFKYLHGAYEVNSVSFYASGHLITVVALLAGILFLGKGRRLYNKTALTYIPYALVGKSFDALNSILYLSAVALAAVSQVTAFMALFPLILFAVVAALQTVFRVRLREKLHRTELYWKSGSVCLLVLGGLLVG